MSEQEKILCLKGINNMQAIYILIIVVCITAIAGGIWYHQEQKKRAALHDPSKIYAGYPSKVVGDTRADPHVFVDPIQTDPISVDPIDKPSGGGNNDDGLGHPNHPGHVNNPTPIGNNPTTIDTHPTDGHPLGSGSEDTVDPADPDPHGEGLLPTRVGPDPDRHCRPACAPFAFCDDRRSLLEPNVCMKPGNEGLILA